MDTGRVVSPSTLFEQASTGPGFAFLDGRAGVARAPLSYLAIAPARSLRITASGEVTVDGLTLDAQPLDAIDRFLQGESAAGRTVIGAIGYGLRWWIEPRAGGPPRSELPVTALHSYQTCHAFDHRTGRWHGSLPVLAPGMGRRLRVSALRPGIDRHDYAARFARVREWIAAGDIYQANLSFPFEAELEGDPAIFYWRLARRSPAPYGGYLDFGDFQILSNSPELFLQRRGASLLTRPIKGTRPRGRTAFEDLHLAEALRNDEKERAEHLMIVDLERNDLGRISETGSVVVKELETVESYATLHHLESTVESRALSDLRFSDCLRAMFPGGSITGAPKIRAMQILDEIEPRGRGFYTGGILHFPPDGNFTMNICIRTATVSGGRLHVAAGGGLVADSREDTEYEECLLKAQAFIAAATEPVV